MSSTLEREIINFNNRYGTKLTVAQLDHPPQKRLDNVSTLFSAPTAKRSPMNNYVALLINTFSDAVKAKIKIDENANYDVASTIDLIAFIERFESIMKLRQEETEYDRERKAYEGANYKKLVKYVMDSTKDLNQAICWTWAEDVVKDEMSYKDSKAITDGAIAALDALPQGAEFGADNEAQLVNVYFAMKAMEMVRQQRGFFFAIFSFRINRREKEYFNQLVAAKNRYQAKGYPIAELQQMAYQPVMKECYEKAEKNLVAQKDYAQQEKTRKEALRNMPKAVDVARPRLQDDQFKEKVCQEILQKLPKCRFDHATQKAMMDAMLMNLLLNTVNEGNQDFDRAVAEDGNLHEVMLNGAREVFITAYSYVSTLGYMDMSKGLAAAQIITDVIMKNYSPILIDEQKYAQFGEGYFLNHELDLEEVMDVMDIQDQFDKALNIYRDLKREAVPIPDLNNPQGELVPPVGNAPKSDVPVAHKSEP